MSDIEDRIRARAYAIWERDGRSGNPEDHWVEAEREIRSQQDGREGTDRSDATVEDAKPSEAVAAALTVETGSR